MKNGFGAGSKASILLYLALIWVFALHAEDSLDPFLDGLNSAIQRDVVGDVQETMQGQPFLGRVYPLIFREGDAETKVPELDQNFDAWTGKKIARINILQRDVFDVHPEREDLLLYNDLLRFGNWIHPQTRQKVLKRNLFFAEGDSLNPAYLIANLHYLYNLGLYSELVFRVRDLDPEEIAIDLSLREKFFLLPSAKFADKDEVQLHLLDRNFLAMGNSLKFVLYVNPVERRLSGWESIYSHPNIMSTFVQGDFHFQKLNGKSGLELKLERNFLYPLFTDFGGVDFAIHKSSPPADSIRTKSTEYGAWAAHAFGNLQYPRYLYAAVSAQAVQYQQNPIGLLWQDALLGLAALGYASPEYRYIPGLSSFLDSDYVPRGHLVQLLAGYEFGDVRSRPFLGLHTAGSLYSRKGHYLHGNLLCDSFLHKGRNEQSYLAFEPVYISPKMSLGKSKVRSLISARFIKSYKALATMKLSNMNDLFYRGGEELLGTDLISLGMEEVINTPYQLFGFQLSAFIYLDFATMEDDAQPIEGRSTLFMQGLGLRLRNPSLIWDFIELRAAMQYLNSGAPQTNFSLNLKPARLLGAFSGKRPQPFRY